MANTLLLAQGLDVGNSLAERDMVGTARDLIALARTERATLMLPVDAVVARALEPDAATRTVAIDQVPAKEMILDIGAKTVAAIEARLGQCRTLVWNGPVGAFETKPFDRGTIELAQAVARLTRAGGLVSIAGGGDTVAALAAAGATDALTYVSAAGGAFLEWLEGRTLPGIAALERP